MKTIIIWLLVSISDGSYNKGNMTPLMEYESKQNCEASADKKQRSFSGSYWFECIEIIKEIKE